MAGKSQIRIPITADDKSKKAFKSANSNMTRLKGSAKGLVASLGPLAVAAAAVGAVLGAAKMAGDALKSADEIHKLSQRLDVSTEALSQYRHVAELSGTSFGAVTKGLGKMQKNLADAADGLSTAKKAFQDINLDVEKLRDLEPDRAFEAIGDAINEIQDPARKTQVALNIFGKAGGELIATFNEGAEGVRKMREEADALGMTLSQKGANDAAAYQDSMTRLKHSFSAVWKEIAINFAPYLTAVADFLAKNLPDATAWTVKAFMDLRYWMVDGARQMVGSIGWLAEAMSKLPTSTAYQYKVISVAMKGMEANLENLAGKYKAARGEVEDFKVSTGNFGNTEVADVSILTKSKFDNSWTKDYSAAVESVSDQLMDIPEDFAQIDQAASASGDLMASAAKDGARRMVDAIAGAVFEGKNLLQSLGSVAKSIFSTIFSGLIRLGLSNILPGPLGEIINPIKSGAGDAVTKSAGGQFLKTAGPPKTASNSGALSIVIEKLEVMVRGEISNDPISVRRFALLLKDELTELASHQGPGVALG